MAESTPLRDDELQLVLKLLVHDLRNPLAAVVTNLGFAKKLVAEFEEGGELHEVLEDSQAACDVVRQLLGNLDVLAQLGRPRGPRLELDLGPACTELLERCGPRAQLAGVQVAWEDQRSTARAAVDRGLFYVALENLVCNAIEHAPRGTTIAVSLEELEDRVTVRVTDHGGAIPERERLHAVTLAALATAERREMSRYSRGAGLFFARLAAEATGMALELGGEGHACELALHLPRRITSG